MKKCCDCKISKPLKEFHKNSGFKDGRLNRCRPCRKIHRKKVESKEAINRRRERNMEYYNSNKDNSRAMQKRYYENNKRRIINIQNEWAKNNSEKVKEYKKRWNKNNIEHKKFLTAKRRAAKLQRTPKWADLETIKKFYENCPEGYHVDHIYPLQGKTFSGLHVLNNLQYLPASENIAKGNKSPEEYYGF